MSSSPAGANASIVVPPQPQGPAPSPSPQPQPQPVVSPPPAAAAASPPPPPKNPPPPLPSSAASASAASASANGDNNDIRSTVSSNSGSGNVGKMEELSLNEMDLDDIVEYLRDNGENFSDHAFTLVKNNFFKKSIPVNVRNNERALEEQELNNLKTISEVQEYEQKLVEKLEKAEQDVEDAPETSKTPVNASTLKPAKRNIRDTRKAYTALLIPVLDVLKSKMKASNTLLTIDTLGKQGSSINKNEKANALEKQRAKLIFHKAIKQYAREIKEVLYDKHNILDMKTELIRFWKKNERVKEIKNTNVKETVETGATVILPDDEDLKRHLRDIEEIIRKLEGTNENPGLSAIKTIVNNVGTPLTNHSINPRRPFIVTTSAIRQDGTIRYDSYKMINGVPTTPEKDDIKKDEVVDNLFEKAIQSAKEGTKVVKMIYKDEPLIISMNISRPNESKERINNNINRIVNREADRIVYPGTQNTMKPETNLSSLNKKRLESEKAKIEAEINYVNTNPMVLEKNKGPLKNYIKRDKLDPIIAAMAGKSKGGYTAKKSKKNNKTKKSTRRSS